MHDEFRVFFVKWTDHEFQLRGIVPSCINIYFASASSTNLRGLVLLAPIETNLKILSQCTIGMSDIIYINHSCIFRCNIDEGAFDVFDFVSLVIATTEEECAPEQIGQVAALYGFTINLC